MKISLPKKTSFSLDELPEYLAKTYQLDLTHNNLIVYARENKLKTCIRLEGNTKGIYAIGRVKVPEEDYLQIHTPPTTIFFNSAAKKSFLPHDLHLEGHDVIFGARLPILNDFYQETLSGNFNYTDAIRKVRTNINEFIEKSQIFPEYEYQLLLRPKEFNYIFSANFYLPSVIYDTNTKLLGDHIIPIDFSDDSFYLLENTNLKDVFINLALKLSQAPTISIHFKQIEVLYSDLMNFLNITDCPQENYSELHRKIKKLKSELEEKDKKITELQIALDDKNIPILLGVHREDDPLKIAIEVRNKYWANYPDNVKSNAQIRDYIIRDYGVTQTLATEIEKIACPIDRKKN